MLSLRPFIKSDTKNVLRWIKSEESFYFWSAGRLGEYPLNANAFLNYYNDNNLLGFTLFDEDETVGFLTMRFLDKDNVRFGFIVVDSEKRRKGYGKKMLSLALKYAFTFIKPKTVSLGVFLENTPALKCYLSVGFKDSNTEETYNFMGKEYICRDLYINNEDYENE